MQIPTEKDPVRIYLRENEKSSGQVASFSQDSVGVPNGVKPLELENIKKAYELVQKVNELLGERTIDLAPEYLDRSN